MLPVVLLAIVSVVLSAMGGWVSMRTPDPKYHRHWLAAFIVVGLIGVGLTYWLAKNTQDKENANDAAQREMRKEIDKANDRLEKTMLEEARIGGQLQGIRELKCTTGNPQLNEMASQITKLTESQHTSNTTLCQDAIQEAQKLRILRNGMLQEEQTLSKESMAFPSIKDEGQRSALERNYRLAEMDIASRYDRQIADESGTIRYFVDQFSQRLGQKKPAPPDLVKIHLKYGSFSVAGIDLVAEYLEELSHALCHNDIKQQ